MADFCKQCSIETFGEDFGDLAGITTVEQTALGFFPYVICEGCGLTRVDHKGRCVALDCLEKHGRVKAESKAESKPKASP